MKPKIVVTQPVHADVLCKLEAAGDVVMNPGPEPWDKQQFHQHLADADALMAFMPDRIDADVLRHAPRLKTIACALKGYDNFDLVACGKAGIAISFVPDLLTEPTAELAIGLAIAAGRHIVAGDRIVRSGRFCGWRPVLYGMGLHRSIVAVVGLGAVGKAIVDRLSGFGCASILGVDPHNPDPRTIPVSLADAVTRADYLLFAVPLTLQTRYLLDEALLAHVKPGVVIVNVGRGSVISEAAIAKGLAQGVVGAYAADVYEMEDWLLPDRPCSIDANLLQSAHTILTPHIGSAVASVRLAIEHRAADNLMQVLAGAAPRDVL
ncbi:hydroxyacid dehydrogenase [Pollutimonas nitritireducens]|uniref:Hydroxyacid dehydrogenase n=1 Tax=Pollutimonas nitritireducens TaxID=2045209 RepID=A0A2N4UF87_9BURK|nr:NAD(P)-dependent oxidoreductase [Pollutimonas nitritireducens]PLC53666.1 hydroxyacid dehydrogenase [Pollutimonas nitritireducens]